MEANGSFSEDFLTIFMKPAALCDTEIRGSGEGSPSGVQPPTDGPLCAVDTGGEGPIKRAPYK